MKSKRIRFLLFMAFVYSHAKSSDDGHRDISPKTPEASSLEKVAEIPVGNYTGTTQISIPIYEIENGDLSLPISLDYLGTAIRVDQESTWVGLNWMLNAGGAITTRLSPAYDKTGAFANEYKQDFDYLFNKASLQKIYTNGGAYDQKIFYKLNGQHPDWRGSFGKNWFPLITEPTNENYYGSDLPRRLYSFILDNGDGESPTYHATFLGQTISFVWDRFKEEFFITGEAHGYRISGNPGNMIEITDMHGVCYEFHAIEEGRIEGYGIESSQTRYDCTFYLTRITSPSGRTITLNYVRLTGNTCVYKVDEKLYDRKYPSYKHLISNEVCSCQTVGQNTTCIRTLSPLYRQYPMRLSSIETDAQVVKFVMSGQKRKDIYGADYSLDKIEIYRKKEDGSKECLRRFCFEYSYSKRNETGGNTVKDLLGDTYEKWFSNDDFMYTRLMLDKMWEESVVNGNIVKKPAYQFDYNGDCLPCKASAAIDFWGFYNGRENYNGSFHTLIPRSFGYSTYEGASQFPDSYLQQKGADRRIDPTCMDIAMLRTITYPTGATITMTYEPHSFNNFDYGNIYADASNIKFNSPKVYVCNNENYSCMGSATEDAVEFTIPTTTFYKLSATFSKSDTNKKTYWTYFCRCPILLLKYSNDDKGTIVSCTSTSLNDSDSDTIHAQGVVCVEKTYELERGKYRLYIPKDGLPVYPNGFYYISASISIDHDAASANRPELECRGGGLRIRSININNDGNHETIKYSYVKQNGGTSGTLMSPVVFIRNKMVVYQNGEVKKNGEDFIDPPTPKLINYWMASGESLTPPAYNNVTYSRVAVDYTSDETDYGKSVYEYYCRRWGNSSSFDYMRRIEDPMNGKLLTQYDYNGKGELIHQTNMTYNMECVESRLINAVMENIYIGPTAPTSIGSLAGNANLYASALNGGCMQTYLYPSVQFSVMKSSTQESFYDGEQYKSTWHNVTYNQKNHLEAVVEDYTSGGQERTCRKILYPTDYTNNALATSLLEKNIIGIPMEDVEQVANKQDNRRVSNAVRISYDKKGKPVEYYVLKNKHISREAFRFSNEDDNLKLYEKASSVTYNSQGCPRMITERNHYVTTYVWGYSCCYPIAVVQGANLAQVQSALGGTSAMEKLETALYPDMTIDAIHEKLSSISGTSVTTYSFCPTVGMICMIAPNGEKSTFDYDGFARLVRKQDHDKIVEKAFNYHYRKK